MIKVLVVDDSNFFRKLIKKCLESDPDIKVIGEAVDGKDAIEKTISLKPDVITMDIEMPGLNGIEAVRQITLTQPTPILMFSSQSKQGAAATIEALTAGAADFLTKEFKVLGNDSEEFNITLRERIHALAGHPEANREQKTTRVAKRDSSPRVESGKFGLIVIGASTGGPVAVEKVLGYLPAGFSTPVLLIQHMPAAFTAAFARRLDSICPISVKEAQDGDYLRPGNAYVAPGGMQTAVCKNERGAYLKIRKAKVDETYKPCIDTTLQTISDTIDEKVLAIILTGMGSDGCFGVGQLKRKGATVWAQDQASSVVYGMPMAVAKANLADNILSLDLIGEKLAKLSH